MPAEQSDNDIILGIDPGTLIMGYGLIKGSGKQPEMIAMGVIEVSKFEDHYTRIKVIYEKVNSLIIQYQPVSLAIEAPFFGKNVQSMLKLGRAQGSAIIAAVQHNLPIYEYAPRKIKQSITGNGNASKEEVSRMLEYLLKFKMEEKFLDSSDALATAVCHYYQRNTFKSGKQYSSWGDFVKKNPGKVK
jgi:crossover junction endodeoxyribonuclease RuvC